MNIIDIITTPAVLIGLFIGSFLNVITMRLPKKEGFVKGRSRCVHCGHDLSWKDLIPLFSFISLRGKCRYCGAKLSRRYPAAELVVAGLFLLAFRFADTLPRAIFACVLFSVLYVIAVIDIETMTVPDSCNIIVALLGVVVFVSTFIKPGLFTAVPTEWKQHLIGAAIIAVPFAVLAYFGGMGGGDVFLMAGAGLMLGWAVVPAAFVGIVLGAVGGFIMKIRGSKSEIPFGPFLAAGIVVGFLWGNDIISWYQSVFFVPELGWLPEDITWTVS
ncbi:MAG: prepilin peptidase [Oscillospiraceae bacterium]|nr:prepilin peptidase [Oscillospiraceae bacterium]